MNVVIGTPQRQLADVAKFHEIRGDRAMIEWMNAPEKLQTAVFTVLSATLNVMAYVAPDEDTIVLIHCAGPASLLRLLKHEELHIVLDRVGEAGASKALDQIDRHMPGHSPLHAVWFNWRERQKIMRERPGLLGTFASTLRIYARWADKQVREAKHG